MPPAGHSPGFAKVFVRLVDWAAAADCSSSYEHPTWRDHFVIVEMPTGGTVEDLFIVSVCRWGRGVISAGWMFRSTSDGRPISLDERAISVDAAASTGESEEDEIAPLPFSLALDSLPRVELPLTFVLVSRPSSFVPRDVVRDVMRRIANVVRQEKEIPRRTVAQRRAHLKELAEVRQKNVEVLVEIEKRREVRAALMSHEREEKRLVERHALEPIAHTMANVPVN